jgi:hypothetical protein
LAVAWQVQGLNLPYSRFIYKEPTSSNIHVLQCIPHQQIFNRIRFQSSLVQACSLWLHMLLMLFQFSLLSQMSENKESNNVHSSVWTNDIDDLLIAAHCPA